MDIPPFNAAGQRETVNRNLSQDETVWHFRSAWNVAALNCLGEPFQPIVDGYRAYITDHSRELKRINDRIEETYRRSAGGRREGMLAREDVSTRVYNFFALPSARADFCRVMLDIASTSLAAPPEDPVTFALANFDRLEVPFDTFFTQYEAYQRASAQWDAKYGDLFGPSQPGWVAVQQARAEGIEVPSVDSNPAATLSRPSEVAGEVKDAETGASVPVIPVEDGVISQPVSEPIANSMDEGGSR
jgi:hypothetical protein